MQDRIYPLTERLTIITTEDKGEPVLCRFHVHFSDDSRRSWFFRATDPDQAENIASKFLRLHLIVAEQQANARYKLKD